MSKKITLKTLEKDIFKEVANVRKETKAIIAKRKKAVNFDAIFKQLGYHSKFGDVLYTEASLADITNEELSEKINRAVEIKRTIVGSESIFVEDMNEKNIEEQEDLLISIITNTKSFRTRIQATLDTYTQELIDTHLAFRGKEPIAIIIKDFRVNVDGLMDPRTFEPVLRIRLNIDLAFRLRV